MLYRLINMARVYPGTKQIKVRSYDFYSQPLAGDEPVYVRRKIGQPCDTLHPSNKALHIQRLRLTAASKSYAKLGYFQKLWWHHHYEWI